MLHTCHGNKGESVARQNNEVWNLLKPRELRLNNGNVISTGQQRASAAEPPRLNNILSIPPASTVKEPTLLTSFVACGLAWSVNSVAMGHTDA